MTSPIKPRIFFSISIVILVSWMGCQASSGTHPRNVAERAQIFHSTCAHCHVGPGIGVPRAGYPEDWNQRETQEFETLVRHTIEGYRNMPPLGTCSFCSEEELRGLIALMIAGSRIEAPKTATETSTSADE